MNKFDKKKKDLASKGMPNPVVKKNVTAADRKAELPTKGKGTGHIFEHPTRGPISFPTQHERDNFARIVGRLRKIK